MRVANRLLCFLFGTALAAFGVAVVVEAVSSWAGLGFVVIHGRQWLSALETTPWSSTLVIGVSIAVAGGGFLLILAELRPERARVVRFQTDHGRWLLLRRSTEQHLARRLKSAVPTSPIKTKLNPKGQHWKLRVTAKAAASTKPALEAAGRDELAQLHADAATVKVFTTKAQAKS
jgi:hypothetical protein